MAPSKTLLVIDDDDDLRGALAEQLELEGFHTAQAATGLAGVEAGVRVRPDLVLLDLDLPDIDGRETCRRLRAQGVAAPVIMLTAAGGEGDTIQGLEAGADDYVTKPFRFGVLLARIRAHLRSHEQSELAVFRLGPYEFHPAQKMLTDGRRRIRLTEKETSILKYLYRASGQPVARDELLAEVWGYNAGVTTHTLETHIYRLRQKVEPAGGAPILLTEAGGYRLQA